MCYQMYRINSLSVVLLTLLFSILIVSCRRDYSMQSNIIRDSSRILHIDPKTLNNGQFDISTIFENISIVKLTSDGGFSIGEIHKIYCDFDHILVLDKKFANSLFLFDSEGMPIRKMSDPDIIDFSVSNGEIFVLKEGKGKLDIFDLSSFTYIRSIPLLPTNIQNIEAIDNDIICYRFLTPDTKDRYNNSTLFLIDGKKGEVISNWLPIDHENKYLSFLASSTNSLKKVGSKIFISRNMENEFFELVNGELINTFAIKLKDSIVFDFFATPNASTFIETLVNENKTYVSPGYFEYDDLAFLYIVSANRFTPIVYDFNNNITYSGLKYKKNSIPLGRVDFVSNTTLCSIIPTTLLYQLKNRMAVTQLQNIDDELFKLINEIPMVEMEPILLIATK